jgi:hypothetical protein
MVTVINPGEEKVLSKFWQGKLTETDQIGGRGLCWQ